MRERCVWGEADRAERVLWLASDSQILIWMLRITNEMTEGESSCKALLLWSRKAGVYQNQSSPSWSFCGPS